MQLGAASLLLAACAQTDSGTNGADSTGDNAEVTQLRFTWWGSDTRHQLTQQVIEAFNESQDGIQVTGEFSDWTGYWDRLATTIAAGNEPDIIQMDERYLKSYAERGAFYDLNELENLDLSQVDETVAQAGLTPHGLGGISAAINTFAVVVNPELLAQAGLELPNDSTWSWQDYVDLGVEISEKSSDTIGLQYLSFNEGDLRTWARQHAGQDVFDSEGNIGVTEETLTQWWEFVLQAKDSGATPSPDLAVEWSGAAQDQKGISINRAAMATYWSTR